MLVQSSKAFYEFQRAVSLHSHDLYYKNHNAANLVQKYIFS